MVKVPLIPVLEYDQSNKTKRKPFLNNILVTKLLRDSCGEKRRDNNAIWDVIFAFFMFHLFKKT